MTPKAYFLLIYRPFCIIFNIQQDYTITIYLNQYWRDERLAYNALGADNALNDFVDLTLSGDVSDRIWLPDTFFANDKNRYAVYFY